MRGRRNLNRQGQALVEFIIILPVFIMLVLGIMDVGRIMYSKIVLEEQIGEVSSLYKNGKSIEEIYTKLDLDEEKMILEIKKETEFINFILKTEVPILTPGLNFVFGDPYNLEISRSVSYDT